MYYGKKQQQQNNNTPLWRRITNTTRLRLENKHVIHVFRYVKIDERVKWFFLNVLSYNSRKLTDYFEFFNFHFITFKLIKHKQGIIKLFSFSKLPQGRTYITVCLDVKRSINGFFCSGIDTLMTGCGTNTWKNAIKVFWHFCVPGMQIISRSIYAVIYAAIKKRPTSWVVAIKKKLKRI